MTSASFEVGEERLTTLINDLRAFRAEWDDLEKQTLGALAVVDRSPSEFEENWRQALHRSQQAFLRVRSSLPSGEVPIVNSKGQADSVEPFHLVLAETPGIVWLCWQSLATRQNLVRQSLSIGAFAIDEAIAEADEQLRGVADPPRSELADLAAVTGCERFLVNLERAKEQIADEEFEDAIHSCRRALERLTTELANRLMPVAQQRPFKDAFALLEERGLVGPATARSVKTPNVGLWGWLSTLGTHDEDQKEDEDRGLAEARLAVERVDATALYMLTRLSAFQERSD